MPAIEPAPKYAEVVHAILDDEGFRSCFMSSIDEHIPKDWTELPEVINKRKATVTRNQFGPHDVLLIAEHKKVLPKHCRAMVHFRSTDRSGIKHFADIFREAGHAEIRVSASQWTFALQWLSNDNSDRKRNTVIRHLDAPLGWSVTAAKGFPSNYFAFKLDPVYCLARQGTVHLVNAILHSLHDWVTALDIDVSQQARVVPHQDNGIYLKLRHLSFLQYVTLDARSPDGNVDAFKRYIPVFLARMHRTLKKITIRITWDCFEKELNLDWWLALTDTYTRYHHARCKKLNEQLKNLFVPEELEFVVSIPANARRTDHKLAMVYTGQRRQRLIWANDPRRVDLTKMLKGMGFKVVCDGKVDPSWRLEGEEDEDEA